MQHIDLEMRGHFYDYMGEVLFYEKYFSPFHVIILRATRWAHGFGQMVEEMDLNRFMRLTFL